jgi:hypothetical protein
MHIGLLLIVFVSCIQIGAFAGTGAESPTKTNQTQSAPVFRREKIEWRPMIEGPSVIQPPYHLWKQLKRGLTKAEVKQLLGASVGDLTDDPNAAIECGIIQNESPVFPESLSFRIWFSNNRVQEFSDPFNGRFSTNGAPTAPELMVPHDGMVFDHFPRFLDFRWYPASGVYPMNYEVEIQTRMENEWHSEIVEVLSPYANTSFMGANEGRWRVRAKNKKGVGEWSGFRRFAFSQ